MGFTATKIAGADRTKTNSDGSNYKPTLQITTARSRIYKLSVSNIGATEYYVWIFDTASGSASSAAPVHVRLVPTSFADTWDFGPDGGLFLNGAYVAVSTVAPSTVLTTPTSAGDDKLIIKADYRTE